LEQKGVFYIKTMINGIKNLFNLIMGKDSMLYLIVSEFLILRERLIYLTLMVDGFYMVYFQELRLK